MKVDKWISVNVRKDHGTWISQKNMKEKSLGKASSLTHSAQNICRSEYLSSSLYTTSVIT